MAEITLWLMNVESSDYIECWDKKHFSGNIYQKEARVTCCVWNFPSYMRWLDMSWSSKEGERTKKIWYLMENKWIKGKKGVNQNDWIGTILTPTCIAHFIVGNSSTSYITVSSSWMFTTMCPRMTRPGFAPCPCDHISPNLASLERRCTTCFRQTKPCSANVQPWTESTNGMLARK